MRKSFTSVLPWLAKSHRTWPNATELMSTIFVRKFGDLPLFRRQAQTCKTSTPGSNPGGARRTVVSAANTASLGLLPPVQGQCDLGRLPKNGGLRDRSRLLPQL